MKNLSELELKEAILKKADECLSLCSFETKYPSEYKIAERKGWYYYLKHLFEKKNWDNLRGFRELNAFTRTTEFNIAFDKFKETYVDEEYYYHNYL